MNKKFLVALCYFALFVGPLLGEKLPYPSNEIGEGFEAAAETYILSDSPLKNEYDRANETLLKNDQRDWEGVLAKIMADPETYGLTKSAKAFSAAKIRGTAQDIRISQASQPLLAAYIKDAEERYEKFFKVGEPKSSMIYVDLSGNIPSFLEIHNRHNLLTVIEFLDSPSEEKIGLLEREVPRQVAAALREYGDPIHVRASRVLAEKLRNRGQTELADDIKRSVERIEKAAARRTAHEGGRDPSRLEYSKGILKNGDNNHKIEFWVVSAVTGGIFIMAILLLFKRRK